MSKVDDMADLIAAMSAAEERPVPTIMASPTGNPFAEATRGPHMAKMVEAFSAATDEIVAEASPELERALMTEATPTGSRIASWEIKCRSDGDGKHYDITHMGETIASDLRLYEAALQLVNALHEGETFTSSKVKTILAIEEEYTRALLDAVQFASRAKLGNDVSHRIAEARYASSKERAMRAKQKLKNL